MQLRRSEFSTFPDRAGRIFMGGADGRLYELKYAAGRSAGCKKVRLREPWRLQDPWLTRRKLSGSTKVQL